MRSAPATQPPEETPAQMPSTRASARVVSSASACVMSSVRSTRVPSKMLGRYSAGHRRMPAMAAPSAGCSPTIWMAAFCDFRKLQKSRRHRRLSVSGVPQRKLQRRRRRLSSSAWAHREVPIAVPVVPMDVTKCVTRPPVCAQISGPVPCAAPRASASASAHAPRVARVSRPHPEVRQGVRVVAKLVKHDAFSPRFHLLCQVARHLHLPRWHADQLRA